MRTPYAITVLALLFAIACGQEEPPPTGPAATPDETAPAAPDTATLSGLPAPAADASEQPPAEPDAVAAHEPSQEEAMPTTPPKRFDPTPRENPNGPHQAASQRPESKAERQVIPLPEGQDPFATLDQAGAFKPLAHDEKDPLHDTLRLRPQTPPEPGDVNKPFPPERVTAKPPEVTWPELRVTRHAPDGDVELADKVTAAFNQPMVPLASLAELDAASSPLTITPQPEGRYVWLGTDTVAFEPTYRLPFATRYTATVKAGARSSLDGTLAEDLSWSFTTPRPKLIGSVPYDGSESLSPDTDIQLVFNAEINPEKVMPLLTLKDVEGKAYPLNLVGRPPADPDAISRTQRADDARRVARSMVVKPERPLPTGMHFVLTLDDQLTCTEGPLTADTKHFVRFATYFPLQVEKVSCSWDNRPCYPGTPVSVEFNNPLKKQKLDSRINVSPEVDGLRSRVQGNRVVLFGQFLPSQKYTINVSMGVEDVFGQLLAEGAQGAVSYREAAPVLSLARTGPLVLEAREEHTIELVAMNLDKGHMTLAYVPESKLIETLDKASMYYDWDDNPTEGLQIMEERELKLTDKPNRIKHTLLDLDPGLASSHSVYGLLFLDVKARRSRGLLKGWDEFRQVALVQVTDLGLTAAMHYDELHVLVTRLSNGKPVPSASVRFLEKETGKEVAHGVADEQGLVHLPGPLALGSDGPYLLVASAGSDSAYLILDGSVQGGQYQSSYAYTAGKPEPGLLGMVFSERGLYRPAEEVHVSVIARGRTRGPDGDLTLLSARQRDFTYTIYDPRYDEVAKGKVKLSPFGTGSFTVTTGKNAPLGDYAIQLSGSAGSLEGSFQVQEFRTPEYEVDVAWQDKGENILVHRELPVTVTGRYFFGAPMNGADVTWTLKRSPASFQPPGNEGFTFGDIDTSPTSRWDWRSTRLDSKPRFMDSGQGKLGADGRFTMPLTLDPGDQESGPVSFTLEAEVYDKNRQSIAGRATILAHRAERYAGIALDRSVVAAHETVEVSGIVTRYDGSRYDDATLDIRLMQAIWEDIEVVDSDGGVDYEYKYKEVEAGRCTLATGETAGKCVLTVPHAGSYVVRAESRDLAGRPVRTATRLWAYGEDQTRWTSPSEPRIELILDRKDYLPGQTAKVLIQSPFPRATGLLTISREGFAEVRAITLDSPNATVEIPVQENWLPGVFVSVALVRGRIDEAGATRDDRGRPMFAHGQSYLSVDRAARRIALSVTPSAAEVSPGETIRIDLTTAGPDGKPLAANVALMVVDEGVLSLIAYVTPDPLKALYNLIFAETGITDLRPHILPRTRTKVEYQALAEAEEEGAALVEDKMALSKSAPRGAKRSGRPKYRKAMRKEETKGAPGGGDDVAAVEFSLREIFRSTAYFDGSVRTDADGKASVTVKMPDNLTRFRIMAIAANQGALFGSAESQVRTRRPLVIRPALPRFLNFGDRFEAAAVVNNETGFDTEVLVRCRADNATITGESIHRLEIRHGEAREVRFTAQAGSPGPARFEFAALALTRSRDTDAAVVGIPTLIPATAEAFATYGVVEEAVRQPILPPANALPGHGGLDITLSSTALTGLQDAVSYLFDYPYECTEQLCSRILPIMALGPILQDFGLGKADTPDKARTMVREAIKRLAIRQRDDGGFGFWESSKQSWLYLSAYVAMTLIHAMDKGFEVDEHRLERLLAFLVQRLDDPYKWEKHAYGSQAMALLVLARRGMAPKNHLERLYRRAVDKEDLTLYAQAWLLEALVRAMPDKTAWHDELLRRIHNAAVETASAVHFSEARSESLKLMMHSNDRTDAIILGTLLAVRPDDPLIEKVTRGLIRARIDGRWATTQANAYALLALADYYARFESDTPDFTARAWHGETPLLQHRFKGRNMGKVKSRVPMADLLEQAAGDLILAREGKGRLYYRLGLDYAPADLNLQPDDRGFMVERLYLPEGEDGSLEQREDGSWQVRAGSYVRVKVRVVAPDRRYYVAVIDPLPAGLEAVNETFATSATQRLGGATTSVEGRRYRWYYWSPWDFEERRDDRVQLFADRMWDGVYEYTYTARATTIGEFVVPPARAEEMYNPETFGRTGTARFVVLPEETRE